MHEIRRFVQKPVTGTENETNRAVHAGRLVAEIAPVPSQKTFSLRQKLSEHVAPEHRQPEIEH
jgi:hypothetical protein